MAAVRCKEAAVAKIAKFNNGKIYDADLSLPTISPPGIGKTEAVAQAPDGATVVTAIGQPSKTRRKAKATSGNTVVPVSRISRHSLHSLV
jgi:hypothetical protein